MDWIDISDIVFMISEVCFHNCMLSLSCESNLWWMNDVMIPCSSLCEHVMTMMDICLILWSIVAWI